MITRVQKWTHVIISTGLVLLDTRPTGPNPNPYYFYMNPTTQNDLNFGDFALLKKRLVLYAFHLIISNTLILF